MNVLSCNRMPAACEVNFIFFAISDGQLCPSCSFRLDPAVARDASCMQVGMLSQPRVNSTLQIDAGVPEQQLVASVIGIRFHCGVVSSRLPPVEEDKMLLPPPYVLRVLSQPPKRPKRLPLANFKIWTLPPSTDEISAGADGSEGARLIEAPGPADPVSRPASSLSGVSKAEGGTSLEDGKKSPQPRAAGAGKAAGKASAAVPPPVVEEQDEATK